jgi:hypothetical protein
MVPAVEAYPSANLIDRNAPIAVSSGWRGEVEIGFGRRAYRVEPPADVYLGVGFAAEVSGCGGFRGC